MRSTVSPETFLRFIIVGSSDYTMISANAIKPPIQLSILSIRGIPVTETFRLGVRPRQYKTLIESFPHLFPPPRQSTIAGQVDM
ncbi:hypothetical protein L1987_21793 [Smallanthus sonchifolius]|uniref:Uncharacterized protein n=1 Tax=Smallanthus sonchifolius TaxID=185202 RepID=A0ACB9ID26_9ASTR|nr:hypothetical protein L1987_21793 [Smallanthus sonchifolius]